MGKHTDNRPNPLHGVVRLNRQGVTPAKYRDEILAPHVRQFLRAVGPDFPLLDYNGRPFTAQLADFFLESEDTARMEDTAPNLNASL